MLRSFLTHRVTWALAGLLVLAVMLPVGVRQSQAAFVRSSTNPANSFSSAASFNTVAVSLTNPGSPLRGSVTLSATASSSRGISDVVFQTSPAGANSWSTVCTKTTAPYSCTWNTSSVGDGLYDVRALATDTAGYGKTDVVTNRRVDNTAPTATTNDPGSPLTGTVSVSGTALDSGSGLTAITLQYRSSVGSWVDLCTTATSPISCSWNTSSLADGLYDLRTIASDNAGNSTISTAVANRRVDNNAPTVTMTDPGTNVRGTLTLQSTSADGAQGSGIASVAYQYKLSTNATWLSACSSSSSPFSCSFDTSSLADGVYDFRAVATDGVGKTGTSATVSSRRIDNTAPTAVTLTAVATPISGTLLMTATATDTGSGLASVKFQYAPAGTTTWTDACTATTFPYSCSLDTTTVADGLYDIRALATDNAGNTAASAVQTDRRIDNNGPTTTLTSPTAGGAVRGTINVTATATDTSGVANVVFQYRATGAPLWTTLCTDTTSPYSCPLDTTTLAGGTYEFRAVATDTTGKTTTLNPITATVDNVAPTAVDIQALNGGVGNTMDAGDTLTFTYSETMLTTSLLAGWNGSSTPVTVRVTNAGANDTLDIYDGANTTRVNLFATTMALSRDVVTTNAVFAATMQQNGANVVVTLGALTSGTVKNGVKKGRMTWSPSTTATDLAGNPVSAATVTESGANDHDF